MSEINGHNWGPEEIDDLNIQQECIHCGLVRFKVFNKWAYSRKKVSEENPFPVQIPMTGCKR